MRREGDDFVARIAVPAGAELDFGFRIPAERGLLDLIEPLWDMGDRYPEVDRRSDRIVIRSTLEPPNEWKVAKTRWRLWLPVFALLPVAWAILFSVLRPVGRRHKQQNFAGVD